MTTIKLTSDRYITTRELKNIVDISEFKVTPDSVRIYPRKRFLFWRLRFTDYSETIAKFMPSTPQKNSRYVAVCDLETHIELFGYKLTPDAKDKWREIQRHIARVATSMHKGLFTEESPLDFQVQVSIKPV